MNVSCAYANYWNLGSIKVTRSNVIPMVLFAAIVVSLGINTPQAANEIIARLFNKSISNTELQPSQADVDRFQSILTDKSEEVRAILAQRALVIKLRVCSFRFCR